MVYFKLDRFAGLAPAVSSRLLQDQFGQIAQDINFETGRLLGTKLSSEIKTLSKGTRDTIYKYYKDDGSYEWLQWDDEVDVAEGPIPGDTLNRLYWADEDYPKVSWQDRILGGGGAYPGAHYRLGVPACSAAPVASVDAEGDETLTPSDVSYVVTIVTDDGREGPPSPPSSVIQKVDGQNVTINLPNTTFGSGHNISNNSFYRLYRSNTGSNTSQFQLVVSVESTSGSTTYTGGIPLTVTSVIDLTDADELAEVIPSSTWIGPPDDDNALYPDGPLQGLMPLAQGVMAGFTGKRFCLSEPFMPHAWPISYRITVEEDIVAIASTGGGVCALTKSVPYFITGTEPSAMSSIRVDLAQACINKHSVVDMGQYVLYAGPDGLCAVEGSQGRVVTKGLITAQQWRDSTGSFRPEDIKAFKHEETYVAFYPGGGWVFDPRGEENSLATLTLDNSENMPCRGGFSDPRDGELYLIRQDKIFQYQASNISRPCTFKSKTFVSPKPVSMGWVSISANRWPVDVQVSADGVVIAEYQINKQDNGYVQGTTIPDNIPNVILAEPMMRLPPVLGTEWEVEVSGEDINEFCIAQSMEEIRNS